MNRTGLFNWIALMVLVLAVAAPVRVAQAVVIEFSGSVDTVGTFIQETATDDGFLAGFSFTGSITVADPPFVDSHTNAATGRFLGVASFDITITDGGPFSYTANGTGGLAQVKNTGSDQLLFQVGYYFSDAGSSVSGDPVRGIDLLGFQLSLKGGPGIFPDAAPKDDLEDALAVNPALFTTLQQLKLVYDTPASAGLGGGAAGTKNQYVVGILSDISTVSVPEPGTLALLGIGLLGLGFLHRRRARI